MELRGLLASAHNTLHSVTADVVVVVILVGGFYLWRAFRTLLLEPWLTRRALEKQGVPCLPYQMSLGKLRFVEPASPTSPSSPALRLSDTVAPLIAPHYYDWKSLYGDLFVFWVGHRAVLPINKLEHMKEILSDKSGKFEKPILQPDVDLKGKSVASLTGDSWAWHRRIVSPAFSFDKLKGMTPAMIACSKAVLDKWESQVDNWVSKEVDVYEEFRVLTADIIAHCAFGSMYIEEGRQVGKLQQEQQEAVLQALQSTLIPGMRHAPTSQSRHAWQLRRRIEAIVNDIILRRGQDHNGNDLLGVLMNANRKGLSDSQRTSTLTMQEIVDECMLFFFAGHETTAALLTWTFLLLAQSPHWQEKARQEVLHLCGRERPTHEHLIGLKVAGMILNEALRLYPPVPYLLREATKKATLGSICVPAKTMFLLPIIDFQHDEVWWGEDAHKFNPQRFAIGTGGTCKMPTAFWPFSMGPRVCLGQNFAMLEARAMLAMTLQRFTFTLSPGYSHCPIATFTLWPRHGVQIIVEKLGSGA